MSREKNRKNYSSRFLRSCYPICEFVLSITTSNVVCRDKNVKTTLQEESGNWGEYGRDLSYHPNSIQKRLVRKLMGLPGEKG